MTETAPERDDDHFEEVLGRLDALVKRGQGDGESLPPPVGTEVPIPLLTEVFLHDQTGDIEAIPLLTDALSSERVQPLDAAILPLMVKVLEDALMQQVQPALENALKTRIAELRPQLEEILRQHLQQALARGENQTEE
jgi:hypothetical protein